MTSIAQAVAALEGRGLILSAADGEIRYRGPKGALTEEDRAGLKSRRAEFLDFLQARAAARALRAARPQPGPLTPGVAQEMWLAFGAGPDQGKPISLNIPMPGIFPDTAPEALRDAVRAVIARHDVLRGRIVDASIPVTLACNPVETLPLEIEDVSHLPRAMALKRVQEFCADPIRVEDDWLMRARIFRLDGGAAVAALTACHFVTDAATRTVLMEDIQTVLDGRALPPLVPYNDFALAERDFLTGPQGESLIDYWRRWYHRQPAMHAPSDGRLMQWGNGTRMVRNFQVPRRVLDQVRALAAAQATSPFLIYLAIFCLAMGRWSGLRDFPLRVLGDKRNRPELSHTAGLMFCADAMAVHLAPEADFATAVKTLLTEYEAALATRLPGLHFWAPHCVRPGIEAADYSNRIPAVFNYYSAGTPRERDARESANDATAALPWPPRLEVLPPQHWTRRSAPLFLHLMDQGGSMAASLHFLEDVVPPADQESFVAIFFEIFGEQVAL